MKLEVVKYPAEVLRRRAAEVTVFDEALATLAADMLETMYASGGVGLAAPQVGVSQRLLVLNETGSADDTERELVLVNPTLKSKKHLEWGEEGCLSFPGIYVEVERYRDVVVAYHDVGGNDHTLKATDFLARIIQHEMDHVDGITFVQRLSPTDRLRVRAKLAELERAAAGS